MKNLTDKKIKKVYIKDGKRKFTSDTGHAYMPAHQARKVFGKMKGGKYSLKQNAI